jgi:Protein kinase domain
MIRSSVSLLSRSRRPRPTATALARPASTLRQSPRFQYGHLVAAAAATGAVLEYLNRDSSSVACEMATSNRPVNVAEQFSRLRRRQTMEILHETANKKSLASEYQVKWRKPLGEGAFGAVYHGTHLSTKEQVAVKKINKEFTDNASFQREMDALQHLREAGGHPNICGLHEHFEEGDHYYLILDLIR